MAVRSFLLEGEKHLMTGVDPDRMRQVVSGGAAAGRLWVDLDNPTPEELSLLDEVFALHPLTIEDCVNVSQFPKFEDFGRYLYMVMLMPDPATLLSEELKVVELDACLGANWVVTYHTGGEMRCVSRTVEALRRNPHAMMGRGADVLFHRVIDGLVDDYFPLLEIMDRETDNVEHRFVDRTPGREDMTRLMDIRRNVLALRRIIAPHRQMIARLSVEQEDLISDTVRVYFRDIADHLARIGESVELYRETIYEALQTHNAIVMHHTNEVMRAFTVVAALMMFPTAIASIFGMNVKFPGSDTAWGFWSAMALMAVLTVGLVWYFQRKRWI
jgi:magnesium transporter